MMCKTMWMRKSPDNIIFDKNDSTINVNYFLETNVALLLMTFFRSYHNLEYNETDYLLSHLLYVLLK